MIWAWIGALTVGLSLGLLGSGGSILTVPILTYLLDQPDKVAIASSLAIVGTISLVGLIPYALRRQTDWRSVLLFGIPGMIGTYGGAWLAVWVPGVGQMLLFAVVVLWSSVLMLRPSRTVATETNRPPRAVWKVSADGLAVGVLTGLVGVGGGFLIVPALVLLGGLDMKRAVATSLPIIAMKSFSGFYKYLDVLADLQLSVDWQLIGLFCGVGAVGSLVGVQVSSRLPREQLQRVFGVFLVGVGLFVLWKNIPILVTGVA
jgi:uncharacterized protein